MNGLTGFKTAKTEALPDADTVMDPFRVLRLAAGSLEDCRRRIQQATLGHRGQNTSPLNAARLTTLSGADPLTPRQWQRIEAIFVLDKRAAAEVARRIYQQMIATYRHPGRARTKTMMAAQTNSISQGVPTFAARTAKARP